MATYSYFKFAGPGNFAFQRQIAPLSGKANLKCGYCFLSKMFVRFKEKSQSQLQVNTHHT